MASDRVKEAEAVFRSVGGTLRMGQALEAGINRSTLYQMRDTHVVERISRGLYRLSSLPELSTPDLAVVAGRIPAGVICLVSALSFHELTTQIPHAVDIAIARESRPSNLEYPPIRSYRFSGAAFCEGIDEVTIDGQTIRIYCPEKSLADIFKYRKKLGLDIALEALKAWHARGTGSIPKLMDYAKVCRVEGVLRPYLEALL